MIIKFSFPVCYEYEFQEISKSFAEWPKQPL